MLGRRCSACPFRTRQLLVEPMSAGANWQVYMLRCRNGALYTGVTTDVTRRLKTHNAGRGAAYVRLNGPGELVYLEDAPDHSAALKREAAIKRYPRRKKLELVAKMTNGSPRAEAVQNEGVDVQG